MVTRHVISGGGSGGVGVGVSQGAEDKTSVDMR